MYMRDVDWNIFFFFDRKYACRVQILFLFIFFLYFFRLFFFSFFQSAIVYSAIGWNRSKDKNPIIKWQFFSVGEYRFRTLLNLNLSENRIRTIASQIQTWTKSKLSFSKGNKKKKKKQIEAFFTKFVLFSFFLRCCVLIVIYIRELKQNRL